MELKLTDCINCRDALFSFVPASEDYVSSLARVELTVTHWWKKEQLEVRLTVDQCRLLMQTLRHALEAHDVSVPADRDACRR